MVPGDLFRLISATYANTTDRRRGQPLRRVTMRWKQSPTRWKLMSSWTTPNARLRWTRRRCSSSRTVTPSFGAWSLFRRQMRWDLFLSFVSANLLPLTVTWIYVEMTLYSCVVRRQKLRRLSVKRHLRFMGHVTTWLESAPKESVMACIDWLDGVVDDAVPCSTTKEIVDNSDTLPFYSYTRYHVTKRKDW